MKLTPSLAACSTLLLTAALHLSTARAQTTEFTYQGRVTDSGTNFNGTGQFEFALVTSTNISSTATATANAPSGNYITGYTITYGGSGYTTAPTVTLSGGGGSGAVATAEISAAGVVTNIVASNPGNGNYTSAPTVTIAPPPADIVYTTYWNNDGSTGSEPTGAVSVAVADGLFTVVLGNTNLANMTALDVALFQQPDLQVRIWFDDGVNGFAALSPAQDLTPTPYAVQALGASNVLGTVAAGQVKGSLPASQVSGSIPVSQISGTVPLSQLPSAILTNGQTGVIIAGTFTGNGASVTSVNAAALNGLAATNFWQLGGNNVSVKQILGTTNNQALSVVVGNQRALLITTNPADSPNFVGGSPINLIEPGVEGSVIAGGGTTNFLSGVSSNYISANFSSIGGGSGNWIGAGADHSFIGSGYGNVITNGAYESVVAGGEANTNLTTDTTIGGGENNVADGEFGAIGGGYGNSISCIGSTVGGGYENIANGSEIITFFGSQLQIGGYATVGGGSGNQAIGAYSTVGGGEGNLAIGINSTAAGGDGNLADGIGSFIGGGGYDGDTTLGNVAEGPASVIGGGIGNTNTGYYAVIGGGYGNVATNYYATIPGGSQNVAGGEYSLAAGNEAHALHQGAFVWADSQSGTFSSTAANQFLIRAAGGVGINASANPGFSQNASLFVQGTNTGGFGNPVVFLRNTESSTTTAPALRVINTSNTATNPDGALSVSIGGQGIIAEFGNSGSFVVTITNNGSIYTAGNVYANGVELTSDRNAKEDFQPLDSQSVLAKVAGLPVTEWSYKSDHRKVQHIGPMAQDFQAAFPLSTDDKHISVVDEGGVALAAIQGLNQKLELRTRELEDQGQKLERDNAALKQENDLLAGQLAELRQMVQSLAEKK